MEANHSEIIAGLQILSSLQKECELSDEDISFIENQTDFLTHQNFMNVSTSLVKTTELLSWKTTSEFESFWMFLTEQFPLEKRGLFWK